MSELLHVLVVEDSEDLQVVYRIQLERLGACPTFVTSGQAALAAVTQVTPDLIMVDLGLPDMNGQELLERFRKRPELASVPIVAATGRPPWDSPPQLTVFDDYLMKPVNIGRLAALLAREADKRKVLGASLAI